MKAHLIAFEVNESILKKKKKSASIKWGNWMISGQKGTNNSELIRASLQDGNEARMNLWLLL